MKHWRITIKEYNNPHPIVTEHYGHLNYAQVKEFFGCTEPDVEWYKIEEIK